MMYAANGADTSTVCLWNSFEKPHREPKNNKLNLKMMTPREELRSEQRGTFQGKNLNEGCHPHASLAIYPYNIYRVFRLR